MNAYPGERGNSVSEPPEPAFFLRWTLIGTLALAPVALAVPVYLSLSQTWPEMARVLALLAIGLIEGLALGGAQAFIMQRQGLLANKRRWILATVAGSTSAWALLSLLILSPWPLPEEISLPIYALWGAHGALIGLAQWLVVRKTFPYSSSWIAVCLLAWVLGEKLSYPCLVATSNGANPAIMLLPRTCTGLSIAAMTGTGMIFLLGDALEKKKS